MLAVLFVSSTKTKEISEVAVFPDKTFSVVKIRPKSKIKALLNESCSKIIEFTLVLKSIVPESQPETCTAVSESVCGTGSEFT